jgi:predicted N-acetyltransferase YhbS
MIGIGTNQEPTVEESLEAIRRLEATLAVWENEHGDIVGAVTNEYPWLGDAFFQQHPRYTHLLAEMLDYAESCLTDRDKRTLTIHIYEHDAPLTQLAEQRGYQKIAEWREEDSEYLIGQLPTPNLPQGFVLKSMADERYVELRREVFGRSFNHTDPAEWPSAFAYEELQRAPDYHEDLDLYIVAPDGQYVSCCIVWYDEFNRLGILEPVGTIPDYRRQGLAREVVLEGIRRAAALGATKVSVGSGQEFYEAIGFYKKYATYVWKKQF